jgi:hypothetical protein
MVQDEEIHNLCLISAILNKEICQKLHPQELNKEVKNLSIRTYIHKKVNR